MTAAAKNGRGRGPLTRGDGVILLAVILAALALRLIYITQYASSPTFDHPIMDSLYHVEWARAFARGDSFMKGEPYFRAPLYPWFLGTCFKIFGAGLLWPRILQAFLGAASAGLVFLIGRRIFGRITGTAAGAAAASYWLFLYFDGELLIPSLIVFLDLAGLYLLAAADERPGPIRYGASGLVFGLSSIARPNILLFGPAAFLWILARNRKRGPRGAAAYAFLFALAWIVPIAPVTVRNIAAGKDFVLISSQGGVNFYIGNNPRSDGTRAVVPGTRPDWWGGYRDAAAMAEREAGRKLEPSAVSRHFFGKALAWIASDPAAWLGLTGRKARFFLNAREIGNNQPIRFFAEKFAPIVRFLPVGFGAIAPLALLGFLLCFRRPGRLFPLWGFAAVYSATVVLFFVCTRYRIPVTAVFIILACEAARWIISGLASPRRAPAAAAVLLLAPLFFWVNTVPEGVVNPDFQAYRILGGAKLAKGDAGGAIRDFEQGLAIRKDYAPLRVDLGRALVAKGENAKDPKEREKLLTRAERELGTALASRGIDAASARPAALYWLGVIAVSRKDEEAATRFFEECLRLDPECSEACRSLGVIHARKGELDAALPLLKRAVDLSPGLAAARFELGKVLALRGDAAGGAAAIEEALRLDPEDVPARTFLADLLARLGRRGEAVESLREALARTPPGSAEARRIAARIDRLERNGK